MLLRDSRQMALNDVGTLYFEAADHYEAAAGKVDDPQLAALFTELAALRRRLAAELADHIRALDDLPQQPDPDREAVSELLSSVKAMFSADSRKTLLDEREQFEHRIAAALRTARSQELPADTQALLGLMESDAAAAIRRLQAAQAQDQATPR